MSPLREWRSGTRCLRPASLPALKLFFAFSACIPGGHLHRLSGPDRGGSGYASEELGFLGS